MNEWIFSIIGIVIINLLAEIILSNSEVNSLVKKIFGVASIFIILSPINNLLNIDLDSIFDYEYLLDKSYLETIEDEQEKYLENYIEQLLEINGFKSVKVKIVYNLSYNENKIEKVIVNLKDLVINENHTHINKYQEIKSIVANALNLEECYIVFNE